MSQKELFVDFRRPLEASSRILRVLGLWSNDSESFFGPNFYTVYALLVLAACNLIYAFEAAYWLLVPSDFETIASSGGILFEELQTNVKVFAIIRHQPVIKKLLSCCNDAVFQPKTRRQKQKAEEVLRLYRWIYVAFGISATCAAASMSFNSLLINHGDRVLPFPAWYPFNQTLHFWPTYIHQITTFFLIAQTHVNIDCFSIGLLAFVIIQCDVLADSIRNLKAVTRSKLEASGQKNADEALEAEKEFYACIEHHKEILRWFQEVYGMLNWIVFAQYASSTVTLCMTLIEATLIDPADPKFAAMLVYTAVMLLQLFLYCWWGNELIVKSSRIPIAAFESGWFEMSRGTKRDLLTFVHCAQTPMELFGGDYFKVSLQNFMLILRHSYSFFAVLRNMNS